jgi:hypothetical protein
VRLRNALHAMHVPVENRVVCRVALHAKRSPNGSNYLLGRGLASY